MGATAAAPPAIRNVAVYPKWSTLRPAASSLSEALTRWLTSQTEVADRVHSLPPFTLRRHARRSSTSWDRTSARRLPL